MGSQGQAVIDRLLARVADLEFCEHAPRDGPRDQHPADEHASSTQQKQTFPDMGDARGVPMAVAGAASPSRYNSETRQAHQQGAHMNPCGVMCL
jgi:hypothetical protein